MRGFTLIETLVAIAVFTVIMGAVAGSIVILYRTYGFTLQQSQAIEEARRGIEVMVKEIRGATFGDDGAFIIEKAQDQEFVFYSDIDGDGKVERVRYFLGTVSSGNQTKECQTSVKGGACGADFSEFLQGTLISAEVKVSLDGDFGASTEYSDILADGQGLGDVCRGGGSGCSDCPATWQGQTVFNATQQAGDGAVSFLADSTNPVDPICPHAMKAKFEFSWTEDLPGFSHEFKKGAIKPVEEPGGQISYPSDQEQVINLSSFVRNTAPIFEYFDESGNTISGLQARLINTKMMKVYLLVNVDPAKPDQDFELESYAQLRNLKSE